MTIALGTRMLDGFEGSIVLSSETGFMDSPRRRAGSSSFAVSRLWQEWMTLVAGQ